MFRVFLILVLISQVKSLNTTDTNQLNQFIDDIYETLRSSSNGKAAKAKVRRAVRVLDGIDYRHRYSRDLDIELIARIGALHLSSVTIGQCSQIINGAYKQMKALVTSQGAVAFENIKKDFMSGRSEYNDEGVQKCSLTLYAVYAVSTRTESSYIMLAATALKDNNVVYPEDVLRNEYVGAVLVCLKSFTITAYRNFLQQGSTSILTKARDNAKRYVQQCADELKMAQAILK